MPPPCISLESTSYAVALACAVPGTGSVLPAQLQPAHRAPRSQVRQPPRGQGLDCQGSNLTGFPVLYNLGDQPRCSFACPNQVKVGSCISIQRGFWFLVDRGWTMEALIGYARGLPLTHMPYPARYYSTCTVRTVLYSQYSAVQCIIADSVVRLLRSLLRSGGRLWSLQVQVLCRNVGQVIARNSEYP